MYVNNLISLQENISTYGIDNGKVTGHVTLSSPGMIKCYVQNLKPSSSANGYVFCAFSKHHNKGIKLGKLGTQRETKWLVDEKDVMGSGIKLEEIDGVALVAEHEMRGVEAVAIGFSKDRYMVLALVENLFPRNEQKSTTQAVPKVATSKPVQMEEKPKVVVLGPGPVIQPNPMPQPKAKPEVIEQEPGPVILPNPMPEPKVKPEVIEQEPGPVILPNPIPEPKVKPEVIEQEPGPVILPNPMPQPKAKPEVIEQGPEPVILPNPMPQPEPKTKSEVIEQGPGPVILPNPMPEPKKKPEVIEQGPGPVILPNPTPCNEYPKVQKEKPCGCKDFILPKDAKEGELVDETNELPINEELKRIIDSISKDKRVEEKAKELEKRIIEMNTTSKSDQSFDKSQLQQTLEHRYMSQKINFEALLEEEEVDELDTNPKKALDCISQMNLAENALDEEAMEEKDYLKEIDKRLQAIKARMSEAIDNEENQ